MAKFKVGDKVDFVNDFGVVFPDRVITGVDTSEGKARYSIEPDECPWVLSKEKNLWFAGTYDPAVMNLKLNCGAVAKFVGCSDWGDKRFEIEEGGQTFQAVLLNNVLYSISSYEEPNAPLKNKFQPVGGGIGISEEQEVMQSRKMKM